MQYGSPLDEFRSLVEERGKFIMIGEEISEVKKPLHMNATNLLEAIPPSGGSTIREAMEANLRDLKTKLVALDVKCLCTSTIQTWIWHHGRRSGICCSRTFLKSTGNPSINHLGDNTTLPLNGFGILPTQFASVNLTLHHYSVSLLMTVTTTTGNLLVEAGFRFDRVPFTGAYYPWNQSR